jgi:radical SAM protein with 4Fe4S-binding SPASM domain
MTSNTNTPEPDALKPNLFGHKATFLGYEETSFTYSPGELRNLASKLILGDEDQEVFETIVTNIETKGKLPFDWSPQEHLYLRNHGEAALVDYLIYRYKFIVFPQKHIVSDFPIHLLIEPSSACNLRCVMCFQVDKDFTRKPYMGLMDFGFFKNIIDQAAEGGTRAISFSSRGEPMMNKNFRSMLRYASEKKTFLDLKINSNATWLDEETCHEILSSNLSVIVISNDAYNETLYSEIRVRGNFNKVVGNVRRLYELREKQYPDSKLEIRISGVKIRDDQNENDFRSFWEEHSDTVVFVKMHQRWDTYNNPVHPEKTYPCVFLWNRLYVWNDGTCNPCDEDYKSKLHVGNAKEMTLRQIWHGEKMIALRNDHLQGNRCNRMPCDRCGV